MSRQLRWKSLQDYIEEDPSLTQKITAKEFCEGSVASQDFDITVKDALNAYHELIASNDDRMKMDPSEFCHKKVRFWK